MLSDNYRERFLPNPETTVVVAIQLAVNTSGFYYRKWGHIQEAKAGDWIIQNPSTQEMYSIDAQSFARSYEAVGVAGHYRKTQPVWAFQADDGGTIETKEGHTAYTAGDWIVFNRQEGGDGYAISDEKFRHRYIAP